MVRILSEVPSFSSKLAKALSGGFDQFADSYAKNQQNKKKLLDYHERTGRDRLLKHLPDPGEYSDEDIQNMHRRAKKLLSTGIPEGEAYYLATLPQEKLPVHFRDLVDGNPELQEVGPEQRRTPSEKKGGLVQLLRGEAEDRGVQDFLYERMFGDRPALSRKQGGLGDALMGNAEPRQGFSSPEQFGLGLLENIKERQRDPRELSQSRGPLSIYNIKEKSPISEAEKESRLAGKELSQGLAETAAFLGEAEVLGTGLGLAVRGIAKAFPPLAEKISGSIRRFAKRFGKTESKIAEEITATAEKEGIDLAKAAQGDRVESARLFKITREYPKGQAQRVKRSYHRAPQSKVREKIGTKEKEGLIPKQVREEPKYSKEIEKYEGERAERRSKRESPSTVRGQLAKTERHKTGELKATKLREPLEKLQSKVKEIEKQMDLNKSAKDAGLLRARLKDAVAKRDQLQRQYDMARGQEITGENARLTPSQLTSQAEKKVKDLLEEVRKGEEISLKKWDYNPERIKASKELPSTPVDFKNNYLQQVHEAYGKEYRQALKEVKEALKDPKLTPKREGVLKKQEDLLQKLSDHIEADKLLNKHQQALVQMGTRGRVAKKLKASTPIKQHVVKPEGVKAKVTALKTEETALGKKFKPLNELEAEKVAQKINKESKFSKEKITPEELKKETEKLGKASEESSSHLKRGNKPFQIHRNFKQFREALKSKDIQKIMRSKLGQDIVIQSLAEAFNEFINKNPDVPIKVPLSTFITAVIGRSPTRILTRATISGIVATAKKLWKQSQIKSYEKAIKNKDRITLNKLREKLSLKQRKEAQKKVFRRAA